MRSSFVAVLLLWLTWPLAAQPQVQTHRTTSPDSAVSITVMVGQQLTYTVEWKGRTLIGPSPISLTLGDGTVIGPAARVVDARWSAADEIIEPVVPEKTSRIRDRYNQLSLGFASGWGLDVRAYDDGAAYRFRTGWSGEFAVTAEEFTAGFESDSAVWFPAEESFLTHSERVYERWRVSEIPLQQMASLPLLIAMYNGPKVAITEADLRSYPGLYLAGTSGRRLRGVFPSYPLVEELEGDRTVKVVERAEYLARTEGPRTFPWRVFVVAENDGDLVESTIVYRLAPPLAIDDPSWIRPGKVAWDWWNATGLFGVDFRAGLNTDTYRYFIDFAADHGLEYVILDEGWSEPADLTALNPDIDLATLLAHARDRDVGVVLWVVWNALGDRLEETLDRFAEWGVAGVKVDFMQRDDQKMVEYYWRVARAAAERRLVVDFHGAYKPTGLRRAYPNVITREGVLGLEHNKWSDLPDPEHNVTLPFIRMLAGPMDYTPGAMRNAHERQFTPVFDRPMSIGTRVHQLAMYVVFESPLQMLSDSPSRYLEERECLAFMADVPTVWDETRVLSARVSDWVAVARRRGDVWYVGAMTDATPREMVLDMSFLGEGVWTAEVFEDGINAERDPEDYRRFEDEVVAGAEVVATLAPGGGWVAKLTRQ
jgi:alpha-glucosidase